ncbi:MAG: integron integrase [Gemmatimonadetes bacterium]|nr:integron integrase [Gemmatimonadota bacterium]
MKKRRWEVGPGLEIGGVRSHIPRTPQIVARILEQVRTRIRARSMSPRTEKTYLGWIKRYIGFHGRRDPTGMGRVEIEAFLGHLGGDLGLGPASLNQAAAAVLFLYRELYREDYGGRDGVARARPVQSLPRYATPEEVDAVMRHLPKVPRMAAMFMYGSGTRMAETMAIRVKDLNLVNRELTVRAGKGAKDRVVPIAKGAVDEVRRQIGAVARLHTRDLEAGTGWAQLPGALARKDPGAGWEVAWQYLFPSQKLTEDPKTGRTGRLAVHPSTIQRALKTAVREAGIAKPLSPHVLRACFATEMIRSGCEISTLQRLMGHRDLKTTARYLHVVQRPGLNIESPLDRLPSQRG